MSVRWESEAELALRAVSTAGEMILDRPERMSVRTKGSYRDVVTELDLAAERLISAVLAPSRHPIVGEEGFSETDPQLPSEGQAFWAVDPIDGTANFVSGVPFFGVSVGLCKGTEFLVGAVSLPAQKEFFFTHGDQAAYVNGKRLRAIDQPLRESLVAVSFSGSQAGSDFKRRQYELFGRLNDSTRGCMRLGSAAANLCYVAAGRLQAAYGYEARIWDVAAGIAIAARAGYSVKVWKGKDLTRLGYLVGTPSAVAELLPLVEEIR